MKPFLEKWAQLSLQNNKKKYPSLFSGNKAAKTWNLMLLDAYFPKSFGEYASYGTPDYLRANISIVALFWLNDYKTKSCKTVMSIFSLNGTQGGF